MGRETHYEVRGSNVRFETAQGFEVRVWQHGRVYFGDGSGGFGFINLRAVDEVHVYDDEITLWSGGEIITMITLMSFHDALVFASEAARKYDIPVEVLEE